MGLFSRLIFASPLTLLTVFTVSAATLSVPKTTTTTTTYTAPLTSSYAITLKPEITGYAPTGCIKKGDTLAILGKNFGTQKGVSLGGHGINVDLPVSSWSSSRIIVRIPLDNRINNGEWYYTGIKDPKTGNWLSNINKNISICASSVSVTTSISPSTATALVTKPETVTTTTPTFKQPGSTTAPSTSDTANGATTGSTPRNSGATTYYDNSDASQWENYGDYGPEPATPSVLPNAAGSLLDRQLPPPPPNLALVKKQREYIQKNTEPDELVVISADMNEARQLAQQLGAYGLSTKRRKILKSLGMVISTFRVPAGTDSQQITEDVRKAYPGMWVDMNHRYQLLGNNRNTGTAKKLIRWNDQNGSCGTGLRIGLIDTGVNKMHPALKAQKIIDYSVLSQGIKPAEPDHGTAIATLLIGNQQIGSFAGLLPTAKLFSAAVFRQRDREHTDTTAEWIINAIDWLLSQQVQVINMSFGGPRNLLVDVAIQRTIKAGVPVIAAAGNSGPQSPPVYPAAQPGVIAVTAVNNELQLYNKASHGKYIDFAAPGVDIWTANGKTGGKFVSGTSYSTPFVTAVLASMVGKLGPRKAYEELQRRAKDLGVQGKDDEYGWGLLQVAMSCR